MSQVIQFLKEMKYAPVQKLARILLPRAPRAGLLRRYARWKGARQPDLQAQLREILALHTDPRAVFVFPPSLDWQQQLFQRPQQLALALARQGALVFYCQIRPPEPGRAILPLSDRLYLCSLPLEQFSLLDHFMVYTMTWNRKYLLKFDRPAILYDIVDDLSTFAGDPRQLARDHLALIKQAQVVVTTAQRLHDEAKRYRPDALLVPNGVDFDHFQAAQGFSPPSGPLESICQEGKPIIGYHGAFAGWFDFSLLLGLAEKRKDLNFLLIGPALDGSLKASGLLQLKNVHFLGKIPYPDLPAFLAQYDVALLPFIVNQITQSTSPIKLFEYFAAGKPVVSTPLNEVMAYKEVCIGQDAAEFSSMIDLALDRRRDPNTIHRLQEIARQNTWDARAEELLQAVEQPLSAGRIG